MKKRILSTLTLTIVVFGSIALWKLSAAVWLITLVSLAAQNELYNMASKLGWKAHRVVGLTIGGIFPVAVYYGKALQHLTGGILDGITVLAIGFMVGALLSLRGRKIRDNFQRIGGTFIGVLFVPVMMTFYIKIALLFPPDTKGMVITLWVVAVAKFSDIGGLLIGSWLGKHKLAPDISPGKTWEGLIGGILSSMTVASVSILLIPDLFPAKLSWHWAALIAIPIASVSALSDLLESVIKRQAEVKDSGKSIPGIGGAFDLIDSLLLSAPISFLLLSFFA